MMPRLIHQAVKLTDGTVIVGRHRSDREHGAINGTVDQFGKFRDHEESVKAATSYIEHVRQQN